MTGTHLRPHSQGHGHRGLKPGTLLWVAFSLNIPKWRVLAHTSAQVLPSCAAGGGGGSCPRPPWPRADTLSTAGPPGGTCTLTWAESALQWHWEGACLLSKKFPEKANPVLFQAVLPAQAPLRGPAGPRPPAKPLPCILRGGLLSQGCSAPLQGLLGPSLMHWGSGRCGGAAVVTAQDSRGLRPSEEHRLVWLYTGVCSQMRVRLQCLRVQWGGPAPHSTALTALDWPKARGLSNGDSSLNEVD